VVSFSLCVFSIVYGVIAGTFLTLHDVYDSLLYGIRWAAPCVLFYILLIQFYESLRFVFG
jgi:aminobenzoyl-glutamate transport protein